LQLGEQSSQLGISFLMLIVMPAMLITHIQVCLLEPALRARNRAFARDDRNVSAANEAALLQETSPRVGPF
jgi:hypothetical protein